MNVEHGKMDSLLFKISSIIGLIGFFLFFLHLGFYLLSAVIVEIFELDFFSGPRAQNFSLISQNFCGTFLILVFFSVLKI